MPFGSGTFTLSVNFTTEAGSPPIEIAKLDTQFVDIASGLSNCILRDGTGLPTTAIPWNSQRITGLGNASADGDALNRITGDGRYVLASGYTAADVLAKLLTVDGSGSGLNADLLDGSSSAAFAAASHSHANGDLTGYTAADVLAKLITVDGAGSGLDADLLDGQSSAFFQNASNLNAGTLDAARLPIVVTSGTYTPSLTNVTNVDSSTSAVCHYNRVGNEVTVYGSIAVDPTSNAVLTRVYVTLPVSSNFAAANNGWGHGMHNSSTVSASANTANDVMELLWTSSTTASASLFFSFMYTVI